jgi:hypothetical protein
MAIPHWLIGLAILAALGSFIVFAFRKGRARRIDARAPGELL